MPRLLALLSLVALGLAIWLGWTDVAFAQAGQLPPPPTPGPPVPAQPHLSVNFGHMEGPEQVVPALKILFALTILTLAPAILISMTSFTRIVIVLSFVRQAIGTQSVPPTQVVMALSLLLTAVVMAPVASRWNTEVLEPYGRHELTDEQALTQSSRVIKDFLVPQTREADLVLFHDMTGTERPDDIESLSLHLVVPAFMISELRTGFEMGFLLFLPFILIDLVVASLLTAMGMVMLPPTMMSTPLKLLLFVLADGWAMLTKSLVGSFA